LVGLLGQELMGFDGVVKQLRVRVLSVSDISARSGLLSDHGRRVRMRVRLTTGPSPEEGSGWKEIWAGEWALEVARYNGRCPMPDRLIETGHDGTPALISMLSARGTRVRAARSAAATDCS
jgi:hypothetical protein